MVFSKKILAGIFAVSLIVVIFVAFSMDTSARVIWPTPTPKPTATPTPTPTLKPTATPIPTAVPKTEILSINAAVFGNDLGYSHNTATIWADNNQNTNYYAPLCLPNKSVITKVAFSVGDNSTAVCAQLWFIRQPFNDESQNLLCILNSTDNQGALRYNYISTNIPVDNSQYEYFMMLFLPATPEGPGRVHFDAAQITYTYYP